MLLYAAETRAQVVHLQKHAQAVSFPGSDQKRAAAIDQPTIIARPDHNISRANISENALKVLYRLKGAGYQAFLVGGGVRDLLLGREPKDFDVATDAHPEDVRRVFRNCRLIGRRFRLAHVHFGREIIEVATFRAADADESGNHRMENGRIVRDNVYGNIEEDAWRRDFTVNALYYDIRDFSVIDYTGGLQDLERGVMRVIGDPERRFREDPVRMLRAVRFAVKLGFSIDPNCEEYLLELGDLLDDIAPARLFEEVLKLFLAGYSLQTFESLRRHGLFRHLFSETEHCMEREEKGYPITFVARSLENTDLRVAEGKPVTPAFLFAAFLWESVRQRAAAEQARQDMTELQALHAAAEEVIAQQVHRVAIPRRFSQTMREIWTMQPRFMHRTGKRPLRFLEHPRFRAAYDFLSLRAQVGEVDAELADWWTDLQSQEPAERYRLTRPPRRGDRRRRSRGAGAAGRHPGQPDAHGQ